MLFSVIVPIYNIEKYITSCIESVLSQSFEDYELILVDDGSPDGCPAICDAYAAKDRRIKVIHKENGGLVSARQAGIRVASGDYVVNLDGDDALLPGALSHMQTVVSETNADIATFAYKPCVNGELGAVAEELVPEGLYDRAAMEQHIFPKLLADENMQHMFYFVWGKAFRRELILPHQLQVDTAISLGEDLSCLVPCYLDAKSVYISKIPVYRYTIRNDSISTDFKTQQVTQIETVIKGLQKISAPAPRDFGAQIARYSCFMCFAILAAAAEGGHFSALPKLKALIRNSLHAELIGQAQFASVSKKSRITISLMQANLLGLAFYFLHLCKLLKDLGKGGKK